MHSNTILIYLLSFIGIKPIKEQEREEVDSISTSNIVSSIIQYNRSFELQDWLSQLSTVALRQILKNTITDHPQIADGIYHRHYEKTHQLQKKKRVIVEKSLYGEPEEDMMQLTSVLKKARAIAHQYDSLRRSDQFTKAPETANDLEQLVKSIHMQSDQSFIALFSIIALAQETISAPSEIRQHIFYQAKFGRIIILEMSTILKNFKFLRNKHHYGNQLLGNWTQVLEQVCAKLSHYDPTWEHRKEYQDVLVMAQRLSNYQ